MLIANPIYDVVFKRLMENNKVAKFFISTILGKTIESVEVKPQEFTYISNLDLKNPTIKEAVRLDIQSYLNIGLFRLDFLATIKTETGQYQKILIEIQKAQKRIDVMRFRNYLAEQYKKEDLINNKEVVLPITTIYILGFKLPEIESPCIKVERNYIDLITNTKINKKSEFVEKLSHDSFVVQVPRITNRYQTHLDKLLSVFEQVNFADDKEITKDFAHLLDTEELKTMTEILHFVGTDPQERKQLEIEQEAFRTIHAMFGETEENYLKAQQEIQEAKQEIQDKEQKIQKTQQELQDKDQELNNLKKQMAELKNQLDKKNKD